MLLEDVRDRTKGGDLISDAFEKQGAFPKIYSTTLMAGEKSGNLDEVLTRFVAFQRLGLTFRKKLIASLVYPVLLVVGVIGLVTMLVTFVIPEIFRAVFRSEPEAAAAHRVHHHHGHDPAPLPAADYPRLGSIFFVL